MEIPININVILNYLLFFAVGYFFAWLLNVKFWLVKFFAVIGGLQLLVMALSTDSLIFSSSVPLAYIVFFRLQLLKFFVGILEWLDIIREYFEALIRILLSPFLYAYRFIVLNKESIDSFKQEQDNQYKKSWDNVNQEKEQANRSRQSSENARKKAEQEKEYYKEQARKAREEARHQEESSKSNASNSSTSRKTKTDNRSAMEILGLNNGFSQADLKKAYRTLSGRFHPDRYAHMSEELQEEMAEEFKKIQKAYKVLLTQPQKNER